MQILIPNKKHTPLHGALLNAGFWRFLLVLLAVSSSTSITCNAAEPAATANHIGINISPYVLSFESDNSVTPSFGWASRTLDNTVYGANTKNTTAALS